MHKHDSSSPTKPGRIQAVDFDDVLTAVGSFGRYQKLRLILLFAPVSFIFGFGASSQVFETVIPPHWCHVPGRENTSFSLDQWKNLTLPPKSENEGSGKLSSCLMYDGFWKTHNDTPVYVVTNQTKKCFHGWEFDRSDFKETEPTQHGWVCDKKHYAQHSFSLNVIGRASGTFLLPLLADNYLGRRAMFFLAVSTYIVFTLPLLWVSSVPGRLFFRFLQGIGFETNYIMPYVIMMEIIPPQWRDVTVMITFVTWTSGMAFLALAAWLSAHWRILSTISFLPFFICFLYYRMLPESPRWLLSKGKIRECATILLEIGKANGAEKISREEVERELHALTLRLPPNEPLTKVFFYPKLRLRALMLFVFAFSQFMMYGIVLLSITVMPGNYFLGHVILTLFEIPSVFIGLVVTHFFGRRFLGYVSLLVAIITSVTAIFCLNNMWLTLGLLAITKLAITCAIYYVFLVPSEILPTPIRTSGAGLAVVSGQIGMSLSPFIIHSGMGETFHLWVLIGLALLGAVSLIPLTETLGLPMPQTFKEGENLGQGRPLTKWIHQWNVDKYPPHQSRNVDEAKGLMLEKR